MKSELPIYKITIDDEYSDGQNLGYEIIAFTAKPAIVTKGFAFSTLAKNLYFTDELKYRICAPVMIPMEIYRCDTDGEYYVQFTVEEIEALHKKFMLNLNNNNIFNLEHDNNIIIPAYVLECVLVDNKAKVDMYKQAYNIDIPIGTVMMTSQITDKDVYAQLIANGQTGYSIEGYLGLKLSEIKQKMAEQPPFHDNCKCELINGDIKNEPGVCDYCLEQSQFNNDTKNKEQKMEENKLILPAGEYTDAEGNCFIVAEDGTVTAKEAMSCEPKEEEMAEEVEPKEEEMADVIESYSKEEVDAKFTEVYKMIADMKSEDDSKEDKSLEPPTELSRESKFSILNKFYENK